MIYTSLTKQKLVVTHRQTILHNTGKKKLEKSSIDQHVRMLFLRQYTNSKYFGGHNISTAGVFLTQQPRNTRISV